MQNLDPYISIKVFISYSHADQELHKNLIDHLSSLKYSGEITIWQDQEIPPGADWEEQIDTHLNEADMILLLISSSFMASNYCWNKEVQTALKRHKAGTVRVIPIILKPVHWQNTPLGQLQSLPTGAKAITQWNDHDAAFEDVVRGIQGVVREDVQKKEKISMLTNEIETNFRPTLTIVVRDIEDIERTIGEQENRKKGLEAELLTINTSIDDLKVKHAVLEDVVQGIQDVMENLRSKSAKGKEVVSELTDKIEANFRPPFTIVLKEKEDIERTISRQEDRKREIEGELPTINTSIDELEIKLIVIRRKQLQLRKQWMERNDQLLTLGANPVYFFPLNIEKWWYPVRDSNAKLHEDVSLT